MLCGPVTGTLRRKCQAQRYVFPTDPAGGDLFNTLFYSVQKEPFPQGPSPLCRRGHIRLAPAVLLSSLGERSGPTASGREGGIASSCGADRRYLKGKRLGERGYWLISWSQPAAVTPTRQRRSLRPVLLFSPGKRSIPAVLLSPWGRGWVRGYRFIP